ncbi:MAG: CHASE sensor domain-containing protein, partial [Smithellaceae bacterium]|nr:CHASE sensor domain-containing protein [Smithellaceae bacterium]
MSRDYLKMLKFGNLSIRSKLIWMAMLVSGLVLILAAVSFTAYEVISFRGAIVRELSVHADVIGINSGSAILFNDPEAAKKTLNVLQAKPNIISGAIYDESGKLFIAYVSPGAAKEYAAAPPYPKRLASKTEAARFYASYVSLVKPILLEGQQIGAVYIRSDLKELEARIFLYVVIALVILSFSLLMAFFISLGLQRTISEPVLHLAETARKVTVEKDYSIRAAKESEDELGSLVQAVNEMLQEIQVRDLALLRAKEDLEVRVV